MFLSLIMTVAAGKRDFMASAAFVEGSFQPRTLGPGFDDIDGLVI